MKNIHFKGSEKNFFEGWYLKHISAEGRVVCFIPGVSFGKNGKTAFIQVITDGCAEVRAEFPVSAVTARQKKFYVKIGENVFSRKGTEVDISLSDFCCKGSISYGEFTPLKYDIMGPFALIPFMECNHGVLSMRHSLRGGLTVNGEYISFDNGSGYIEKDWGRSFPKAYSWAHFSSPDCSAVLSVADIPFLGLCFKGHIAAADINGKQYRFATYNGSKVIKASEKEIELKRGAMTIKAQLISGGAQELRAPDNGAMSRIIREHPAARLRLEMYKNGKCLYGGENNCCGYEYVSATE